MLASFPKGRWRKQRISDRPNQQSALRQPSPALQRAQQVVERRFEHFPVALGAGAENGEALFVGDDRGAVAVTFLL